MCIISILLIKEKTCLMLINFYCLNILYELIALCMLDPVPIMWCLRVSMLKMNSPFWEALSWWTFFVWPNLSQAHYLSPRLICVFLEISSCSKNVLSQFNQNSHDYPGYSTRFLILHDTPGNVWSPYLIFIKTLQKSV